MNIKYKIVIPLSLIALLSAGCWGSTNSTQPSSSQNTPTGVQPTNASPTMSMTQTPTPTIKPTTSPKPTQTSAVSVSIANFAFSPASVNVKKGTTVTWTNHDSASHTVTGDSGGPASGPLANGDSYSFTFMQTGTFSYHCNIHPSMVASVTVTQ